MTSVDVDCRCVSGWSVTLALTSYGEVDLSTLFVYGWDSVCSTWYVYPEITLGRGYDSLVVSVLWTVVCTMVKVWCVRLGVVWLVYWMSLL